MRRQVIIVGARPAAPQTGGETQFTQIAFFEPKGLFGLLYWYALYPIHALISSGLIRQIGECAD